MPASGSYFYPGINTATLGYRASKLVSSSLSQVSINAETSGSIYWLSDVKFLVVYGPLGWTRILTGSGL
jgi:hypothetical protein